MNFWLQTTELSDNDFRLNELNGKKATICIAGHRRIVKFNFIQFCMQNNQISIGTGLCILEYICLVHSYE